MNHFDIGKRVVLDRQLYIIFAYNNDRVVLVPADQSGYVRVVQPFYTQWKKSDIGMYNSR